MPTGMGIGFWSWRLSEGAAARATDNGKPKVHALCSRQASRPIEAVKSLDRRHPGPDWQYGLTRMNVVGGRLQLAGPFKGIGGHVAARAFFN